MPSIRVFTGDGFGENCYLIARNGRAVVVDPGAAAGQARAVIEAEGLALDSIVLTHAHLDHIEGIPALGAGADVPIWLHPADQPLYDGVQAQAAAFGLHVPPLPAPTDRISAGVALDFPTLSFEVRFAPGHAPGHVVLLMREEGILLCGDVVFRGSIGRTDLPGGDSATLLRSIRDEILTLDDSVRLLPGHGPETTVGAERASNPFLAGL